MNHIFLFSAVGQLGYYLMEVGHLEESETYLREALHIQRGSLQVKHPHTALSASKFFTMPITMSVNQIFLIRAALQWLGDYLMRRGKNDEAEKLLSEAVNIQAASLSPDHPNRIDSKENFIFACILTSCFLCL